mmetsp:Transcript_52449/g.139317  ORF Transcript_52449/g.139317 Transcript_52449/m.139317 type:complete len:202 (+) Transcript_52449:95-700(+)
MESKMACAANSFLENLALSSWASSVRGSPIRAKRRWILPYPPEQPHFSGAARRLMAPTSISNIRTNEGSALSFRELDNFWCRRQSSSMTPVSSSSHWFCRARFSMSWCLAQLSSRVMAISRASTSRSSSLTGRGGASSSNSGGAPRAGTEPWCSTEMCVLSQRSASRCSCPSPSCWISACSGASCFSSCSSSLSPTPSHLR